MTRRMMYLVILSLICSCALMAQAPTIHSPEGQEKARLASGELKRIERVDQLPGDLPRLVAKLVGGMANPGEVWNDTCIRDPKRPNVVLEEAMCSRRMCAVRYGDGGLRPQSHVLRVLLPFDGETEYFPPRVSDDKRKDLNDFERECFGRDLRALHEPSLWLAAEDKSVEVYRFTYLPTFNRPISVRLEMVGDGLWVISGAECLGAAGFRVGALSKTMHGAASAEDAKALRRRVDELGLWSYPTTKPPAGADGAQWIFEMVKDGHYHIINRWSPEPSDKLRALELHLLRDIAQWKINERALY